MICRRDLPKCVGCWNATEPVAKSESVQSAANFCIDLEVSMMSTDQSSNVER